MKKIIITLLFVFSAIIACSKSESSTDVVQAAGNSSKKMEDANSTQSKPIEQFLFDDGLAASVNEQKHLIVSFYAEWCGWCKRMESEVFGNPRVQARFNKDFVFVKIDLEKEESLTYKNNRYTNREFAQALNVSGLPTMAIFDPNGDPVTVIPGYIDANTFLQLLDYFSEKIYLNEVSFQDYQKTLIK